MRRTNAVRRVTKLYTVEDEHPHAATEASGKRAARLVGRVQGPSGFRP